MTSRAGRRASRLVLGAPLDEVLPLELLVLLLVAMGLVLYGIVALAVTRATGQ